MLQYKIPQDVQIEDKIVGPLTLKQLLMVAAGGGITYGIFLIMSDHFYLGIFDYFWIGLPLIISVAFAFLRINDVSFLKWIMLLYEYGHNSRRRRWDKVETARLHYAFVTAKSGESAAEKKAKEVKKIVEIPGKRKFSSLEELTYVLDHTSKFGATEKTAPDDHEEEYALHLSGEEKVRHESRLDQSIQSHFNEVPAPVISITPPLSTQMVAPEKQDTAKTQKTSEVITKPEPVPAKEPQENSSFTPSEALQVAPKENTPPKAVDMVHPENSPSAHKITFEELMRGGQISFS